MPIGQGVPHGIVGHLFPHALFILGVAIVHGIKANLADVVEQCRHGNGFRCIVHAVQFLGAGTIQIVFQALVHIQTVFHQPALICPVKSGAGGGSKEIAGIRVQPFQQPVCSPPLDIFLINGNKFFSFRHGISRLSILCCILYHTFKKLASVPRKTSVKTISKS